jgi:hypothetical protein
MLEDKIAGCDAGPERMFSMSDVCGRLARICQMLVEKSQFGILIGTWLKAQLFWRAKNPAGYRRGLIIDESGLAAERLYRG